VIRSFKALGLSALLLGLMAFATSAAQAETGAAWMVNGTNINSTLLPELQVKDLDLGDATLLTELSKKKVELLCTGAKLEAVRLGTEGGVDTGGRAIFTGCTFKWGGVVQPKCVPHSAGDPEGTIKTEKGHGLIQLHEVEAGNKEGTTLLLPDVGELFALMILGKAGELNECAAGEHLTVNGKLSLKDCNKKFAVEEVTHLVVELPALTDLWILNKTAEHAAHIDGSANVILTGAHEKLPWSGLPK
jgi:hypothetical protein